jgi:hypothetical protein
MQEMILALLKLFQERAPDRETNAWVTALASDRKKWPDAHDLFDRIRGRGPLNAKDFKEGDAVRCTQYIFEELCLKTLYNETHPRHPFDPSSPFAVTGSAIHLARTIGVAEAEVIAIAAVHANPKTGYFQQVFSSSTMAATSAPGRLATSEEIAIEFPELRLFPQGLLGPYERNMGDKIVGLLELFRGRVPDATSSAVTLQLASTPERWSAGHALFDILFQRLLEPMRKRDAIRYYQHEFECSCLQAIYSASDTFYPFPPGAPFWIAGAAFRLARVAGVPEQSVAAVLAPMA